eukprot:598278-Hanusia_phi.AAC.4
MSGPEAFEAPLDVNVSAKSYAYVTLLTRDPYLPGVVALLHSLRKTKAKYPVLCVVGADVSKEARAEIELFGGIVREFDKFLPFPEGTSNNYANPLWIDCWMKLHLWELTEYRKMVYLDADMVVRRNIDHLFDEPAEFLAAQDCYNGGDPEDKARGHYHDPEKCFYSSSCPCKIKPYFNAGFFVFTPSHETASDMKKTSRSMDVTQLTFAEQDFMNDYFKVGVTTSEASSDMALLLADSNVTGEMGGPRAALHVQLDQYDDWIELWEEAMKFRAETKGSNGWKHIGDASVECVNMFGKDDSFIVAKLRNDGEIEWCYRTMVEHNDVEVECIALTDAVQDELRPIRSKIRQEKAKLKEQACANMTITDSKKETCKVSNIDRVGSVEKSIPVCN